MAKLSHEKLKTELIANMNDGEYKFCEMYVIYESIMNMSLDLRFEILTKNSFREILKAFSEEDDSLIIKKGKGKKTTYHKWVCHRNPKITRKQIHEKVKEWLRWPK